MFSLVGLVRDLLVDDHKGRRTHLDTEMYLDQEWNFLKILPRLKVKEYQLKELTPNYFLDTSLVTCSESLLFAAFLLHKQVELLRNSRRVYMLASLLDSL